MPFIVAGKMCHRLVSKMVECLLIAELVVSKMVFVGEV